MFHGTALKYTGVLCLLLLAGTVCTAQESLFFNHLSTEENLSQSSVYTIIQDNDGFMWFGTRDGLNRYDSHRNIVYRHTKENPASLCSNSVNALALDRDGRIWVGTSGGLNLYRPITDDFIRFRTNSSGYSLSHNNISAILQTRDGSIWIGTRKGLSRLADGDQARFENYLLEGNPSEESGSYDVKALYEDSQSNLWVGTTVGLSRLTRAADGSYTVRHYSLYEKSPVWHTSANWINAICENSSGHLWLGTETKGIAVFDPSLEKVIGWNPLKGINMDNHTIRTIKKDKKKQLWIGTMSGLIICSEAGDRLKRYINMPDYPGSLSDNSIRAIHEGRDGTVWVGTFYGGVNYYHPFSRQFGAMKPFNRDGRKPFKIAGPMLSAGEDNVWMGSEDNGLLLIGPDDQIRKHYFHDPADPNSLSNDKVKCLLKNGDRGLWIGTLKGLNYLDLASGRMTRYLTVPHDPATIPDDRIYDLAYDTLGQLWVGTFRGGLCIMDQEAGTFRQVGQQLEGKGLRTSSVTCLLAASGGKIWVGTSNGLACTDASGDHFRHFSSSQQEGSLSANYVVALYEDRRGGIWVSTRGGGLNLIEKGKDSFKVFADRGSAGGGNIFGVREDNNGNIWFATGNGLSKLSPETGKIVRYDQNDGLVCREFLPNSVLKDTRGRLLFGGYNGIIRFSPDSIRQNPSHPLMAFTGLRLFNREVAIGGPEGVLAAHVGHTREIRLNHRQNVFSVEFASMNYVDPEKNQFAYLLEGFEKEWNYVREPVATYMNLEPGTYKLKVKGSNNNNVWNESPLEMRIVILPPPWKTAVAYGAYVLIFLGMLYTWSRYHRERLQLSHDLQLEHLEKQQQEELHRTRIHFFTNIVHEIRTPLTLIMGPMRILEEEQYDNPALRQQLNVMKGSTDRLMGLADQLLDFQKHEMGNVQLKLQKVDLTVWLQEIAAQAGSYAVSRNIELEVLPIAGPLNIWLDPGEMEKVLHNLLINAFKFTPTGGQIRISASPEKNGRVSVFVEDNGIGISPKELDSIFRQFYQVGNSRNPGFGIGLALCKSIVELHGGTISVESAESLPDRKGFTRFIIELPAEEPAVEHPATVLPPIRTALPDLSALMPSLSEQDRKPRNKNKRQPILLLVEDQDDIRSYLKDLLAEAFEVIEAADGQAGWELASTLLPDLIVSDISMTMMDGIELTNLVKTDPATNHIPVILLTAYDSIEHQLRGLEHGADDYVAKPFHPKILLTRIHNLLRVRQELKEKFKHKVRLEPAVAVDSPHPDAVFLQKLMQVIETNIENPDLNLADLVQEMGMSRPVLFRKIKMLTDSSVMDLVRSVRLRKAESLLKQKKMSVSEVAFAVGFNDPKYFSKSFRNQFGRTPSEYLAG